MANFTEIAIPSGTTMLKWDWMASYYWMVDPNDGADIMVKISTDGGTSWTDHLWIEDDETLVTNSGVVWPWANFTYYTSIIDISSYAGQNVQIAWHYYDFDGAQTEIDNIEVFDIVSTDATLTHITTPTYAQPGDLAITGII